MSLPNIPDITPSISLNRCDSINLLLSSIALEEIGLSHILNAEGEKLQLFLKMKPKYLEDLLNMNHSVNKTLQTVIKSQLLLVLKLEEVVELIEHSVCDCDVCDCEFKSKHCKDESTDKCKHHVHHKHSDSCHCYDGGE